MDLSSDHMATGCGSGPPRSLVRRPKHRERTPGMKPSKLPRMAADGGAECPITLDRLRDPVVVPCCGRAFSRHALRTALRVLPRGDAKCPLCRASLVAFDVERAPRVRDLEDVAITRDEQPGGGHAMDVGMASERPCFVVEFKRGPGGRLVKPERGTPLGNPKTVFVNHGQTAGDAIRSALSTDGPLTSVEVDNIDTISGPEMVNAMERHGLQRILVYRRVLTSSRKISHAHRPHKTPTKRQPKTTPAKSANPTPTASASPGAAQSPPSAASPEAAGPAPVHVLVPNADDFDGDTVRGRKSAAAVGRAWRHNRTEVDRWPVADRANLSWSVQPSSDKARDDSLVR